MLLVALTLTVPPPPPVVWRHHRSVRGLTEFHGELVAATSGGVLAQRGPAWVPLGEDAPAGMTTLTTDAQGLVGTLPDGRQFRLVGTHWRPEGSVPPATLASGWTMSADGRWRSGWGSRRFQTRANGAWVDAGERSPTDGDYVLFERDRTLWAGTPDGLFRHGASGWVAEPMPGELPSPRMHGFAHVGGRYLVGGLNGLWIGRPGDWSSVTHQSVRQIVPDGSVAWVLYGDGSVDKFAPAQDRRYPDVLNGSTRRNWTSCLTLSPVGLLMGGHGGWVERRRTGYVETYPSALKGQVVTALAAVGKTRFVGTQQLGLVRFDGNQVKVFNPGNGLSDPWVTALLPTSSGLLVGTSGGGLFRLSGDRITAVASPTQRVQSLAIIGGAVWVGGMDGCWRGSIGHWSPCRTLGEETTALTTTGPTPVVLTASGVFFRPVSF